MVEWIFFDVGSVLFDDVRQNYFCYRFACDRFRERRPDFTFTELLRRREVAALAGESWILHALARDLLPEREAEQIFVDLRSELLPLYDDFHPPARGAMEMLEQLRSRYRLGIIANQPPECRNSLERRKLLADFEVVAISELVDLHKPDPAFYRWAIQQAGCAPEQAVMIGDRIDNDIAPARSVGMKTILVLSDVVSQASLLPDEPEARDFVESCRRVSLFSAAVSDPQPDRTIERLPDVPAAVAGL
ncbi:MAG: HAD-IA family hydrolase [Planctomycetes bacterium]|nr:HAD-IA family hydrolase [Planctomycetota bacterium]